MQQWSVTASSLFWRSEISTFLQRLLSMMLLEHSAGRNTSIARCNDVNTLERSSVWPLLRCFDCRGIQVNFPAPVESRAVRSALPASKYNGGNDGRVAVPISVVGNPNTFPSGGLASWLLTVDTRCERVEIFLCTESRRAAASIYNLFISLSQCGNDWYSLLQSVMGKPSRLSEISMEIIIGQL